MHANPDLAQPPPAVAANQTGSRLTWYRGVLFAIFTVSGFSGLIYESIWSHYLKLFLGHSAYSQTLVLAIFMGGMALGSWLVARYTHKLRNLLLGYAIVEAVTGIIAMLFHNIHTSALEFAFNSVIPALGSAATIDLFKWSLAAALILPQSILLGTTFPLISGAVIRRFPDQSGATLAMLYFTNSLGASLGVLASGFWLIAAVGLPGTVMTAGVLNIALACIVWLLTRSSHEPPAPALPAANAITGSQASAAWGRWILLAAAGAGMAAFIYEIAWIRMLTLVLGASTHAFELMLSAFIFGLALGGLWIRRRMDRFQDARTTLAIMFALMAVSAALTLPAYGSTFEWLSFALRMFDTSAAGYTGFNLSSHVIAAFMMIPTTFVAGMTLPLMTHWLYSSGAGERSIGSVYAANTVGAIAGVMIAVHWLLPTVGMKGTILAGALLQLMIALLFLGRSTRGWNQFPSASLLVAACVIVGGVSLFTRLDPMRMAAGVYRTGAARLPDSIQVLYAEDGKTATIALTQDQDVVTISTNGKPDASLNMGVGQPTADEVTQTLLAVLPLAIHPDAGRVANIGFGSGVTSQIVLRSPGVKHLDTIEIEPAMTRSAWIAFSTRISRVFSDPRSSIHYDDAKSFFASSRAKYDVIISEPSNPWVSGVATLFSDEFYQQVSRYISDDGLLVQWIQIYETDMEVVASVIKALSANFADYAIYNAGETDIVVVASKSGAVPDPDAKVFAVPALASELRRVGIQSLAQIQLRRIGSKKTLDPLFATYQAPRNSDYYPYVDLNAPRLRYMKRNALGLGQLDVGAVPVARLLFGASVPALPDGGKASYGREQRAVLAVRLAAAIATADYRSLEPRDVANALLLREPPGNCVSEEVQQVWTSAVSRVSIATNAYLPSDALARLWTGIKDSACYRETRDGRRRWLDFLALLATADSATLADAGLALWQMDNNGFDGAQSSDLLVGTAAALIGSNRKQEAQQLLTVAMASIGDPGPYELTLRWLTGLANDGSR